MNEFRGTIPSAGGRHDWAAEQDGRTFYQRTGVCVTDRYLYAAGRRYDVGHLRNLRTTRSPHDPLAVGVTIVAAVLVLAVVIGWPKQGQVSGWVTTGAVSLVTVVAAIVIGKVRRRHYELWAHYRGADVRVLDLASGEIFWQICRALIRAREAHDAAAATAADAATATERPAVPAARSAGRAGGAPAAATAGRGKVGAGSVVAVRTGAGNFPAVRVTPTGNAAATTARAGRPTPRMRAGR